MYNISECTQQSEWDEAYRRFEEANLLQSWQWGESQLILGFAVERRIVRDGDTVIGLFSASVKNARRGRYLEVAGGPLINWNNSALVDVVVNELRTIARHHSCVFMRIRTQLPDTSQYRTLMHGLSGQTALMHVTADHTSIIDLTPKRDELMTAMRQQTRYEIRRAPKRDIVVEKINALDALEMFHELQVETAKRQNFYAPSSQYLESLCTAFGDEIYMYKATKHDTLLNLALVIMHGTEAAYFEAASTTDARREPGAYAIVWQAMQDAKSLGIQHFNLWGTAPADSPNHRYSGVTTFKRGFGGEDVAYLPAYDIPLKTVRYQFTRLVEAARKKRRHL